MVHTRQVRDFADQLIQQYGRDGRLRERYWGPVRKDDALFFFVFPCFRVRCAREGGSVISGFELDFEVFGGVRVPSVRVVGWYTGSML